MLAAPRPDSLGDAHSDQFSIISSISGPMNQSSISRSGRWKFSPALLSPSLGRFEGSRQKDSGRFRFRRGGVGLEAITVFSVRCSVSAGFGENRASRDLSWLGVWPCCTSNVESSKSQQDFGGTLAALPCWVPASVFSFTLGSLDVLPKSCPGFRKAVSQEMTREGPRQEGPRRSFSWRCKYLRWFTLRFGLTGLSSASLMLSVATFTKFSSEAVSGSAPNMSSPQSPQITAAIRRMTDDRLVSFKVNQFWLANQTRWVSELVFRSTDGHKSLEFWRR